MQISPLRIFLYCQVCEIIGYFSLKSNASIEKTHLEIIKKIHWNIVTITTNTQTAISPSKNFYSNSLPGEF